MAHQQRGHRSAVLAGYHRAIAAMWVDRGFMEDRMIHLHASIDEPEFPGRRRDARGLCVGNSLSGANRLRELAALEIQVIEVVGPAGVERSQLSKRSADRDSGGHLQDDDA